jgi:hypothetical protein
MKTGIYHFNCCFESEAFLPVFKGSTLRGALGHSLKQTTCALKRQDCANCMLATNCGYAFLFEVKTGNAAHRPHPYVFEPPLEDWRFRDKGGSLEFAITLFGKANDYLPHIVYAIREMGQIGLGKKKVGDGRFSLESVRQGDQIIYEGTTLQSPTDLPDLTLEAASGLAVTKIMLSCSTPLRLKYDNQLQNGLPFHLLIRAALRRISSLEAAYGNGEPPLDYKGLVAKATDVQMISSTCRWVEIERYSNRQKTSMFIGGILGETLYHGENLSEFIPFLRYCEAVHLGKQTSFGLGRIQVGIQE